MYLWQIQNLLPKRLNEGVALNRLISNIKLQRFRGFKKRISFFKFSKSSKLFLGALLVLFLAGYQPAATFPPVKRSIVLAEFSQQQTIDGVKLAEAFNLPHPGYLTTRFSSWHPGIDIATGLGMPVRPLSGGKVVEAVYGFFGYGHYVVIEHEQGFRSLYGHMGRIFVKKNDPVTSYTVIGEVGMTGRTSGPHTHLELTRNGQYVDPQTVLPSIADWPAAAGLRPQGEGQMRITPIPAKNQPTPTPIKTEILSISGPGYFKSEVTLNNKLPKLLPLLGLQ